MSVEISAAARALLGREAAGVDAEEAAARAAWSIVTEAGDGVAGEVLEQLGACAAWQLVREDGRSPSRRDGAVDRGLRRWRERLRTADVTGVLLRAATDNVSLVVPGHPRWPARLADLGPHAPACLWVRGTLPDPALPVLALVGARAATSYGENVAAEWAQALARDGVLVVSGGAYGIDGAAHRGALAGGGRTLAVLAGGVDRPTPVGHAELFRRIAASSALVSELPPGSVPTRSRFLQRNRLIAAWAQATVVVEAGWRSGSLNTAGHAAALGRALGAVPGPVTSAASSGCHRLLREFDAQCVGSPDDVRELLGLDESAAHGALAARDLAAVPAHGERTTADIARMWRCSQTEAATRLALAELEGQVRRSGDRWRRA